MLVKSHMHATLLRLRKDEQGTFAVELALLTPVLLILLMGALDLTAALHRQIDLQNAARTGAHYASIHKPLDGDVSKVVTNTKNAISEDKWYNAISASTPAVTASLVCGCVTVPQQACTLACPAGERRSVTLQIQAAQDHKTLFTYPVLDDTFPLSATVNVRLQ